MSIYGTTAARERHGWFLGLTGAQVALLLVAATPAWLAMAMGRWAALLVLAPAWVLTALVVTVPVRGWSAAQWVGILLRQSLGQLRGWTTWRSAAATELPQRSGAAPRDGDEDQLEDQVDLPGVLTGIRLHDGPPLPGRIERPALIQDLATRTWALSARLTHPGIGMASDPDRDLMGSGLAELLESCSASGHVHHLALQVRTVPDDGTHRADWVRHHRQPEPDLSADLHHLLDQTLQGAAVRTEIFLTVVADEASIGRDARRSGRGTLGRARVLHHLAAEIEARLLGALGCTHVDWLGTSDLAAAIRTGFEPGDAAALAQAGLDRSSPDNADELEDDRRDGTRGELVPLRAAGPVTARSSLRHYRHGDWASSATTILLPRKGALMGALARVLLPSVIGERRALTVFYRPLTHAQADRTTGRAEMSAAMGAELRRRVGRVERASERRASHQVHLTDEKLQRGRALVQVTTAVSVTVPAHWDAADHAHRLHAAIRLCGFAPLPLDGAHDAGFAAATIPLGVGLPRRRAR
jgi:hypothetical protein